MLSVTRVYLLLLTFIIIKNVKAAEVKIKQELQAVAGQVEMLKNLHKTEFQDIRNDLQELKKVISENGTARSGLDASSEELSLYELRVEVSRLRDSLQSSSLGQQLHRFRAELKEALEEGSSLLQLARAQTSRVDHLETEVENLQKQNQQLHQTIAEMNSQVSRLAKEIKTKEAEELASESYNDVLESDDASAWERHEHKLRHRRLSAALVFKVAHTQDRLDERQNAMQALIHDLETRLDSYQAPNWNLLSATVDMLSLESKVLREQLAETSQKLSDFDKVHASVLELREDVENIENKADRTIPEIRKEISKLEINYAQLNAASSYLKEDQENLRQSVKAIAVSVSNAVDRAELDRLVIHRLNDSIAALHSRTKHNFHRLNDHILKSEARSSWNQTDIVPLPELMGEVKELQPVESEYQDLVRQLPRDCSAVSGPPGVYLIRPGHSPLDAWCANGSTLLQRRYNGSVDFNRKFHDYERGFGDATGEYWLGLDAMHRITADNCSSMRIDMTDIYGGNWYAQYEHFSVGSADSGYILQVSGFNGNASDAFEYQNHMEFSTIDHDRDISNTHCAGNYEGGWWFSHCQHVNINGKYTLGLTWFDAARNEWIAVASSEMRLHRRRDCP